MARRSKTETLVRLGTLLLMAALALPLACSDQHSAPPTPVAGMDGRFISVDGFGPGRAVGDGAAWPHVDGRGFSQDGAKFIPSTADGSRFVSIDGRGFIGGDGAYFDHDAGAEDAGN